MEKSTESVNLKQRGDDSASSNFLRSEDSSTDSFAARALSLPGDSSTGGQNKRINNAAMIPGVPEFSLFDSKVTRVADSTSNLEGAQGRLPARFEKNPFAPAQNGVNREVEAQPQAHGSSRFENPFAPKPEKPEPANIEAQVKPKTEPRPDKSEPIPLNGSSPSQLAPFLPRERRDAEPSRGAEQAKPQAPAPVIIDLTPYIPRGYEQKPVQPQPQARPENRESSPFLPPFNTDSRPLNPGDRRTDRIDPPGNGPVSPEKVFELNKLKNRSADHDGPDAIVQLPRNFDPSKPIHLVIYNHGWGDTVKSSFQNANLGPQMADAPPNTVLILPEWQKDAGASNGNQGRFKEDGRFNAMLQEILDKTPGLSGKTLRDVQTIGIIAHSAGYNAAQTEIKDMNGLGSKITSITLLDANYNNTGFDKWLNDNIRELANGTKRFQNIFNDTSGYSKQQADRVEKMLRVAGLPQTLVHRDYQNGASVMTADEIAQHSIIFKFSSATTPGRGPHAAMPRLYVAPIESAEKKVRRN